MKTAFTTTSPRALPGGVVTDKAPGTHLPLWGGIECTRNRVGDVYLDQFERAGHEGHWRLVLELIAATGVTHMRYPALWEHALLDDRTRQGEAAKLPPPEGYVYHLDRHIERLEYIRSLGMVPIVGLLHHGSGPPFTNLTDPALAGYLADYARQLAAAAPWVRYWTPINEPLTTARFAGLYGLWYPHALNTRSFLKMVMVQTAATRSAMVAIREVSPEALLIQTEDLGHTHARPALAKQAAHDNTRRWLTWDLLAGTVAPGHPLFDHLIGCGADATLLQAWTREPFTGWVAGINHYVTSERYLDERLGLFPLHTHGGNGRQRYADIEAVRAPGVTRKGWAGLIAQTAARYPGLPLAVSECQLACTREEQLRWFYEAYMAAADQHRAGVPLLGFTAWSMTGAYDWDSLLTQKRGHYEPGALDLRLPTPRPTAHYELITCLARQRDPRREPRLAPALVGTPWWQRPERFLPGLPWPAMGATKKPLTANSFSLAMPHPKPPDPLPPVTETARVRPPQTHRVARSTTAGRPILITGATGTLGRAMARICILRGLAYRLVSRQELDITDEASIARTIKEVRPWAIVNTAGYVRVDEAEADVDRCHRENALGPLLLARAAADRGIRLVNYSSDLVFDGLTEGSGPEGGYIETDTPNPVCVYGESKLAAERALLETAPDHALTIRTSAFFGPWDSHNFVYNVLRTLLEEGGTSFGAADDLTVTATSVPCLCQATLDLLFDGMTGIVHLSSPGAITWAGLAQEVARRAHLDEGRIEGVPYASFGWAARRPARVALESARCQLMAPLDEALDKFLPLILERARQTLPLRAALPTPTRRRSVA